MSPDHRNYLFRTYPRLFPIRQSSVRRNINTQTERGLGIACLDGWFPVLDALCERYYVNYQSALNYQKDIEQWMNKRQLGKPEEEWERVTPTAQLLSELKSAQEWTAREEIMLPQFLQIEERYGVLRIKLDGTPEQQAMADLATAMSRRVCEQCGNRGYFLAAENDETVCARHIRADYGPEVLRDLSEKVAADAIASEFLPNLMNY